MLVAAGVWLLLSVLIGAGAGNRGRFGFGWFVLSLVLSPLVAGLILLVLGGKPAPDRMSSGKKCPDCAERVQQEARLCRYCGHTFEDDLDAQLAAGVAVALDPRTQLVHRRVTDFVLAALAIVIVGVVFLFLQANAPAPTPLVNSAPAPAAPIVYFPVATTDVPAASARSPAMPGNEVSVATAAIRASVALPICPTVTAAARLKDGTIRAQCSDKKTFLVFVLSPQNRPAAVLCSSAAGAKGAVC